MIIEFSHGLNPTKIDFIINSEQRIGAMVSGGADSALVLWILCKHHPNPSSIQVFCMDRPNGSRIHSKHIVEWISDDLHIAFNPIMFVGDNQLPHFHHIRSAIAHIRSFNIVDIVYGGSTQNPPPGLLPYPYPTRAQTQHQYYYNPFLHCTKQHIHFLYDHYQLNGLLETAHSCGSHPVFPCGGCFSCAERRWGASYRDSG